MEGGFAAEAWAESNIDEQHQVLGMAHRAPRIISLIVPVLYCFANDFATVIGLLQMPNSIDLAFSKVFPGPLTFSGYYFVT